jgi:hypothetical protein
MLQDRFEDVVEWREVMAEIRRRYKKAVDWIDNNGK